MSVARGRVVGPFCPIDPSHGTPLRMDSGRWHCPDQEHDGRPATHPLGYLPISRTFFTEAEVYGLERETTNGNQEDR